MIEQSLLNIICFLVGAMVVLKAQNRPIEKQKEKGIQIPSLNPLEAYRSKQSKKELQLEADKLNTILNNIENYDGTGNNQEDIPKGE